jgi:hypothetical protein
VHHHVLEFNAENLLISGEDLGKLRMDSLRGEAGLPEELKANLGIRLTPKGPMLDRTSRSKGFAQRLLDSTLSGTDSRQESPINIK